ncbi:MAG: porin family protein [Prolixibacteraceae bacterium]|jgi:hypothetical protein|nr:porin family protein [Prolixibacteraceae bacterium]
MKKFYILILLTITTFTLPAQEFYGGMLAGFNGSQIDHDTHSGYHKMGLIGGAWVQRDLSPNWYWGMELKVNQKGMRIRPTKDNGQTKYVYRLNYIDLPVLIGYSYDPTFSFFGGLSFGYLFNKNAYDNYGKVLAVNDDNITNWELGMFAGIKVNFKELVNQSWAERLTLETRFQYSAMSIDEYHDFFTRYKSSIGKFNNVISTVLYYRIEWGKNGGNY